MFCAVCGARFIADARFCEVCGLTKGVKDEDNTILTFDDYRDRKRKERSSRFVSKSVKKVKKENSENEVTIQIGLIRLKDGQLKAIRGSSLPLKVFPSIGAEELLRKGAEKMVKFNSDLSLYGASSFTLLYPDRTEVKCLPGGTEPFTLQRYKEELGKAYGRITLYLCKTTAIMDALFLKSYYSDESDVSLPTYEELTKMAQGTESEGDIGRRLNHTVTNTSTFLTAVKFPHSPNSMGLCGNFTLTATGNTITTPSVARNTAVTTHTATRNTVTTHTATSSTFITQTAASNISTAQTAANSDTLTQGVHSAVTGADAVDVEALLTEGPVQKIILYRALLKDNLIETFKDPTILHVNLDVTFTGSNGREEEGKGADVLRDALSTFWN
nr:uncharacterized protein LOC131790493 [Pocillopora verrucosa]